MFLVVLVALATTACGDDDEKAETAARTPGARRGAAPPPKPTYPEPEVIDILRVIDSTRVAAGVLVRDRSQSEAVLEYARVMRIDHRAISRLLDSLLVKTNQTAQENALSRELRTQRDSGIARLAAVDTGFNNGYMALEIAAHEQALALLDTILIRSAKTPDIKTTLEQLRPAYAAHLQFAREILAARQAAAARRAAAPPSPSPVPMPLPRIDTLVTTTTGQD